MKLEVGMYVRTKKGNITKIIDKRDVSGSLHREEMMFILDNGNRLALHSLKVVKASHNIIDLIEEKDLLEIEYFSLRYEKRVTRLFEVTYKEGRFINLDNAKYQFMLIDNDWTENDKELEPIIKSIVTKEQFESMSYKVSE